MEKIFVVENEKYFATCEVQLRKLLAPVQSNCKAKVISSLKTLTPGYISFHFNFAPITPEI